MVERISDKDVAKVQRILTVYLVSLVNNWPNHPNEKTISMFDRYKHLNPFCCTMLLGMHILKLMSNMNARVFNPSMNFNLISVAVNGWGFFRNIFFSVVIIIIKETLFITISQFFVWLLLLLMCRHRCCLFLLKHILHKNFAMLCIFLR